MAHSYRPTLSRLIAIGVVVLGLAGCVSGRPTPETYTTRSGSVTNIETDRESCVKACESDYARCGEMLASTRSDVGSEPTSKVFGVKADCREALKTCLPRCKGR